ncbi:hypothetical protein MJN69_27405, partial [Salmonella enterica subsp. enterica serovar Kentucky]|nr:hypothetical protein [Salmonella enterica subsp. enterica serovar Kentucky]
MTPEKIKFSSGMVIAAGLWQLTPPSGLSAPAWHSAIIFVATIASIVAKVLPIGA